MSMAKKSITKASLLAILTLAVSIANLTVLSQHVYAQANGASLAPAITSYANPQTGVIADGGSNEALGDSMCQSIVEDEALVEISDGKTYVTIGFGLASNISSVRITVQTKESTEEYKEVEAVETGRYEKDNDDCVQYRFEVVDAEYLISPILYVEAMGRSVQFYIRLDMEAAVSGTGNYVSEMVIAEETKAETEEMTEKETETESETESETEVNTETAEDIVRETVDAADVNLDEADGLHIYEIESQEADAQELGSNVLLWVIGITACLLVAAALLFILKKKRR